VPTRRISLKHRNATQWSAAVTFHAFTGNCYWTVSDYIWLSTAITWSSLIQDWSPHANSSGQRSRLPTGRPNETSRDDSISRTHAHALARIHRSFDACGDEHRRLIADIVSLSVSRISAQLHVGSERQPLCDVWTGRDLWVTTGRVTGVKSNNAVVGASSRRVSLWPLP